MRSAIKMPFSWLFQLPLWGRLTLGCLALAALYTLMAKLLLIQHASGELEIIKARKLARIELAAQDLVHRIDLLESDTRLLANSPAARQWVAGGKGDEHNVQKLFLAFAEAHDAYTQVRLLDAQGHEVVRVNRRSDRVVAVQQDSLQDKSGRYYVRDTATLGPDQTYISPLDLNIEGALIEQPYRPMLRAGTPLFDGSGERRGAVLLNLDAESLLTRFTVLMGTRGQAMLLNQQGDWLVGPEDRTWGFMFGKPGAFAEDYPEAWTTLQKQAKGEHWIRDGLLLFTSVYPLEPHQNSASGSALANGSSRESLDAESYRWVAASLLANSSLPSSGLFITPLRTLLFFGGLALLMSVGVVSSLLLEQRQQARSQSLRQALRYRQITANLAEGLLVMNPSGEIIECNLEAERLLGWPAGQLVGRNCHRTIHQPSDNASCMESSCPIQRITLAGEAFHSDRERFYRRDGSAMPVNISAAPLKEESGVVGTVMAFHDISDRLSQEAAIKRLAYHDPLTGLPNRRQLMERLEQHLATFQRHGHGCALAFLDLDHFKAVNDTYGHEAGDALLIAIADRLDSGTRRNDLVCRQGGDEFVLLLDGISSSQAADAMAQHLLKLVSPAVCIGDHEIIPSVSLGIAWLPVHGPDADSLLHAADAAMYRAKRAGRNAYRLAGVEDNADLC